MPRPAGVSISVVSSERGWMRSPSRHPGPTSRSTGSSTCGNGRAGARRTRTSAPCRGGSAPPARRRQS